MGIVIEAEDRFRSGQAGTELSPAFSKEHTQQLVTSKAIYCERMLMHLNPQIPSRDLMVDLKEVIACLHEDCPHIESESHGFAAHLDWQNSTIPDPIRNFLAPHRKPTRIDIKTSVNTESTDEPDTTCVGNCTLTVGTKTRTIKVTVAEMLWRIDIASGNYLETSVEFLQSTGQKSPELTTGNTEGGRSRSFLPISITEASLIFGVVYLALTERQKQNKLQAQNTP